MPFYPRTVSNHARMVALIFPITLLRRCHFEQKYPGMSRAEVLELLQGDLDEILLDINDLEVFSAQIKQSKAWGRLGELLLHIEPAILRSSTRDDLFQLLGGIEHLLGNTRVEEQETSDHFGLRGLVHTRVRLHVSKSAVHWQGMAIDQGTFYQGTIGVAFPRGDYQRHSRGR